LKNLKVIHIILVPDLVDNDDDEYDFINYLGLLLQNNAS